jgi:hypothetical protein
VLWQVHKDQEVQVTRDVPGVPGAVREGLCAQFESNICPALPVCAQFKLWIKPSGEMSYLYGNNVLKAHLGRITENTPMFVQLLLLVVALTVCCISAGIKAWFTTPCLTSLSVPAKRGLQCSFVVCLQPNFSAFARRLRRDGAHDQGLPQAGPYCRSWLPPG